MTALHSMAKPDEILLERAKRLASPVREEADEVGLEVLTFQLLGRRYGVAIDAVWEVLPAREHVRLPRVPMVVSGVAIYRGAALMVVDLPTLLEIPRAGVTDLSQLLVLGRGRAEFGCLVEAAEGVEPIPAHRLVRQDETLKSHQGRYLQGLTHDGVAILSSLALFESPQLWVDQREGREAPNRAHDAQEDT